MWEVLNEIIKVGLQFWWPIDLEYHLKTNGDWRVEIIIGAILTQNTKWEIVEKVINKMKEQGAVFDLNYFHKMDENKLIQLIKSVSFNRTKAKRIKNLSKYVLDNYKSLDDFFSLDLYELRKELLKIKGIGKETADVIILYSSEKPIFVVDSYTRKLLLRFGIIDKINSDYEKIRVLFERFVESNLNEIIDVFKEKLGEIDCRKKLKEAFNYIEGLKCPLNPCDLIKNLDKEKKLVIVYKELHAMIDIYMKNNKAFYFI